jgi:hypothetical protein
MTKGTLCLALCLAVCLASVSAVPSANFSRTYADGTELRVVLIGEDAEIVRLTVIPPKTASTFHRYQGYIRAAEQSKTGGFVKTDGVASTSLVTPKFSLEVSKSNSTTSLVVNGVVVSSELTPVHHEVGVECVPKGWKAPAPGQAATLSGHSSDSCLRSVRLIDDNEDIYGFGQVPEANLTTVGQAKFLATFSRNELNGLSHAVPLFI